MKILALEFSSAQRSVAVAHEGQVLAEASETGAGRGTNAFRLIENVLVEAKIEREEIEVITVGLGPGSYTGIRAAISIAQGWQLAREIKLVGVSSVEAIAAQAQTEKKFGRVNVIIDAQRNEFYLAVFEIFENDCKEIMPLKIVACAEIQSLANAGKILIGPGTEKLFGQSGTVFPRASVLAQLGANRSNFLAGEKLEPVYLRETNFVKSPTSNTIF